MKVGDRCIRTVSTADPDESIRTAARRMLKQSVGSLVVVDRRAEPAQAIGIVTHRDLVTRGVAAGMDLDEMPVSMVMSVPAQSVDEDRPLEQALDLMSRRGIRRLVVVDESGALTGILALDDVLEALVRDLDAVGRLLERHAPIYG